jgi:hypothetical protein
MQTRQQIERFVFEVEVNLLAEREGGGRTQPLRPSNQEELEDALRCVWCVCVSVARVWCGCV